MTRPISEPETIRVHLSYALFDRACDHAWQMARDRFGIDEDGYSDRLPEWERSCCHIVLTFEGYQRHGGSANHFTFIARAMRCGED